jgi:hypothetical protein
MRYRSTACVACLLLAVGCSGEDSATEPPPPGVIDGGGDAGAGEAEPFDSGDGAAAVDAPGEHVASVDASLDAADAPDAPLEAADAADARPSCEQTPGTHPVTEYGAIVADNDDAAVVAANTATVRAAIDALGKSGGGAICLPAGTYRLAPPKLDTAPVTAVLIDYDNITLWGAGMDGGTHIKTRGDWSLVGGNVMRGVGIWIKGTADAKAPRRNVTLRDFELDGGSGYTGKFGWPADTTTGDGWDISHKGIILSADDNVDGVRIERVWVHSYKGEIIYAGGLGLGKVTVVGIRSEDTNGSTYNITADATVSDSEFGKGRFWIEIGTMFQGKAGTFTNNHFHDANVDGAIALAQGDLGNQPYVFENNRFDNCPGSSFLFVGGVGGPVTIRNNTFTACGGIGTSSYGHATTDPAGQNQKITFEGNALSGGAFLANFFGHGRDISVKGNTFTNPKADKGASTAAVYCGTDLTNAVVENNTFDNMRAPEQSCPITTGERPLFRSNTYKNAEVRFAQGHTQISVASPTVTPLYEQHIVDAAAPNVAAAMSVDRYPDTQTVAITGGSTANPVKFAAGAATYQVGADRTLDGTKTLTLRFDKAAAKWTEVSFQ